MLYAILFLLCQDVDRLIEDLGHDKVEIRESATKSLIKIGKNAIPKLESAMKRSKDAEVWQRSIRILEDINYFILLDAAITPRGPIALSYVDAPIGVVLRDLAKQAGLDIVCLENTKVTINATNNNLIPILDNLGAQLNKQWGFHKNAVFWNEGFVKSPSVYDRGIKVALARLDAYKSWDNREHRSLGWLYFKLFTEPQTKLMSSPVFELSAVVIDGEEASVDSMTQHTTVLAMLPIYESSPFTINKNSNIKIINKIVGRAKMQFAAKFHDMSIDIDHQDYGTVANHRNMEFRIVDYGYENIISMNVQFSDETTAYIGSYVDTASFIIIDHDGAEHKGENLSVEAQQQLNTMKYDITIKDGCSNFKTVKFRVVDKVLEHSIPFSFNDIPIP